MIDTGLVIDTPWIRKIRAGEKTWENRSKPNSKTGRIALCEKGGPIVATASIGRSISIAAGNFERYFDKHQVPVEDLRRFYGERPVYAWPLSDVREIDPSSCSSTSSGPAYAAADAAAMAAAPAPSPRPRQSSLAALIAPPQPSARMQRFRQRKRLLHSPRTTPPRRSRGTTASYANANVRCA